MELNAKCERCGEEIKTFYPSYPYCVECIYKPYADSEREAIASNMKKAYNSIVKKPKIMEEEPINGIWSQWQADTYHANSPKLAAFMSAYLPKDEHVIDIGCGSAFYISELAKAGFECTGVEGFQLNNFLHPNVLIHDLTKPLRLVANGSVICLEVIEHIDKQYEQVVLDSITSHCTEHLIFSWALEGQAGVGHVNTRPQEYSIEQIERRGFMYLPRATKMARINNVDDNTSWFKNTLLIFRRR
jgi:hypothetical protein